ncbi:hypothetical protein EDD11_005873 [Mortierella claussenii]|nr:hypothetical protein EDD11_005873 [Mortierella claussenii]
MAASAALPLAPTHTSVFTITSMRDLSLSEPFFKETFPKDTVVSQEERYAAETDPLPTITNIPSPDNDLNFSIDVTVGTDNAISNEDHKTVGSTQQQQQKKEQHQHRQGETTTHALVTVPVIDTSMDNKNTTISTSPESKTIPQLLSATPVASASPSAAPKYQPEEEKKEDKDENAGEIMTVAPVATKEEATTVKEDFSSMKTTFEHGETFDTRPSTPSRSRPSSPSRPSSSLSWYSSTSSSSSASPSSPTLPSDQEPRNSFTRPLSRQEIRRKSSFFNNKDIAVSDQRYSTSASASMRPIADPRFKSRFQNVLAQWKARAGN